MKCEVIGGVEFGQQRPPLKDVVASQGNEHRVLDVVVEGVAIANAFEREPRRKRESSARRACETPNRSLISSARNDPSASAAKPGRVIMDCADGCCGKGFATWSTIVFACASGPACPAVPAFPQKTPLIHAPTYRQSARPIASRLTRWRDRRPVS